MLMRTLQIHFKFLKTLQIHFKFLKTIQIRFKFLKTLQIHFKCLKTIQFLKKIKTLQILSLNHENITIFKTVQQHVQNFFQWL